MNIFNGRDNYGPIIDVMELPDGTTTKINHHAIYRLIQPSCIIDDPPCGYYKVTVYSESFDEEGLRNDTTHGIIATPEDIIEAITVDHDTKYKPATINDDNNKSMTLAVNVDGSYRYLPGIKMNAELLRLEDSVVIDHYIYDIDHWVSIGNAIAYVDTLPDVTDPLAETKVFVHEVGIGGGAYEIKGIYILDKENGEWIELMKNRVIMIEKADYEAITPVTDMLYVVV